MLKNKMGIILEGLASRRVVEAVPEVAPVSKEGEVVSNILFCFDCSTSINLTDLNKYLDYIINLRSTLAEAKIDITFFGSKGIKIKKDVDDKFIKSLTPKNMKFGTTDHLGEIIQKVKFSKYDTIYICTDGQFNPTLTDEDIKTVKKSASRIKWLVSKANGETKDIKSMITGANIELL